VAKTRARAQAEGKRKGGGKGGGKGQGTPRAKRGAAAARDDRGKRLLDLVIMLLGARQPVPYRELRSQFKAYRTAKDEAGLRAFERDKADLVELGVPLRYVTPDEDDAVEEAGYFVDLKKYRLPEIHLTPAEVAALVLAGSVARAAPGTTYAEVVDLAVKKLAFDAPPAPDTPGAPVGRRRPPEPVVVHYPRSAEEISERLAVLEPATVNHKRVTMRYLTSSTALVTTRDVDPYGLYYRDGSWYLVGWCHAKEKVLSFRLDRMESLSVAPRTKTADFERPANFDVRRYAARSPWTFETDPPVEAELDILPEAAPVANEDFGESARRSGLPDGGVKVRFRCANPDFLVSRVLAAKGALVVRGPRALRERVEGALRQVLGRYAP
jgi:proteasome accessory factor B